MCKRLLVLIPFVLMLVLSTNAQAQPTGEILVEYWNDMDTTNTETLYNSDRYPDSPDEYELLTVFDRTYDRPAPHNDNYAARIRGFLYPPETGDYSFWIAADDDCDLFLSTNDDPANKVQIAEINGWCPAYDWDNTAGSDNPDQASAPVALEAGVKYYVEVVYKEGGGGDGAAVAWQGPGIPDRVIIDGAFLSPGAVPLALLKAGSPNPADGAVDADVTALEWAAGATAVSHKVYLSSDETIDDADLVGETDLTIQVATLDAGATYYWRVDEIEADGNVLEGNVWSFTTLPLTAHFPSPADAAEYQALDSQLSWTGGKDAIMHNVHFGTDPAALLPVSMMQMGTSYDPGPLEVEATYYWRVDEFTPAGTVAGPVWSFATIGGIEITDPDLLLYYDFETPAGAMVIDQSGHSNHGQFNGTPELVDGLFGTAVSIDIDTLDYIETAAPLGIVSNTVSVTGWVKHDELPAGWSGILTHRGSGNLGLQHDGTELRYMWGADQYWDFSSGLALPVGEWYFAAVTISPDQGKLYLNGVEQTATNVAPHDPVNFDSLIRVGRDHNDGRIMTSLIDEVRLYDVTLTDAQIQGMVMSDVTAPGDVVQGDPNEPRDGDVAGWPDGEYPWLAIDDDASTKFLHFRGEVSPTGFVVEPAMGPTIVTGLTLTTANDSPNRDPASFELSGSNESIDGPYELIAAGDVVDFAQEAEWPRFTMNATAISFDNAVAYKYYQVMFPTVRDAGSANSMQIAEVELLGVPAPVARWEFDGDYTGTGPAAQTGLPVGDIGFEYDSARGLVVSLPGGDDQYVDLGGVGISGNMPKTITCWAKADHTSIPDWTLIFGFTGNEAGEGGNGSHFNIGSLGGPGGVGAHCWGWEETIFSDDEALEWHHYAMTYDGTTIQYYGDGALMDTDLGKSNVQDLSASADRVHVGSRITQASSFPGKVDDARVYMAALSPIQIQEIATPSADLGPLVIWVSGFYDDNADGAPDDQAWIDLLEAEGYNVDYTPGNVWIELDDAKIATLNAADLVIVSRNSNSGDYNNDEEPTEWNAITTPLILSSTHIVRSSRWKWVDSTSILSLAPAMILADGTEIPGINADVGPASFIDAAPGNGTVLATGDGLPFIIEWEAGVEFYDGAGQIAGGPRMFFTAGSQEGTHEVTGAAIGRGEMNLTDEGLAIFLDAVAGMIQPVNILANGGLEDDLTGAPWGVYGDATLEVVHDLVDAAVPDVPVEGEHCLHVTVNSAGANFWDAGLQHGGHVFEAGKSYTLSAWFKSKSGPFQINVKPERAATPWDGFGSQEITITEEWDVYTVNTGVIADIVDPASITFHIAYAPGEFWMDNAVFTED